MFHHHNLHEARTLQQLVLCSYLVEATNTATTPHLIWSLRTVNVNDDRKHIMGIRRLGGHRLPAAWREVALRTSDTCFCRHDVQIGAGFNPNSATPSVRAIRQLLSRASALSTVVRRLVSTREHESFYVAQETQRCAQWNVCAVIRRLGAIMS